MANYEVKEVYTVIQSCDMSVTLIGVYGSYEVACDEILNNMSLRGIEFDPDDEDYFNEVLENEYQIVTTELNKTSIIDLN